MLTGRLLAEHRTAADYLEMAERDPAGEIAAWARELTVTETYFLRHVEQFNALTGAVLAERRRAGRDPARLTVLSAGCATGEEAYSLAIALREQNPAAQPSILGVDINAGGIEHARRAIYTPWSLRALPQEQRERWFTVRNDRVRVDASVLELVRFRQLNIMLDDPAVWRPSSYDVVFCRNVLMYLRPAVMEEVVHRIAVSLMPGGFLFLGSAETLRGISSAFQVRESHGAFYYQRTAEDPAAAGTRAVHSPDAIARAAAATVPVSRPADATVSGRPVSAPAAPMRATDNPDSQVKPPADPYAQVLELLRLERFHQALDRFHELTGPDEPGDPDAEALLLRAALLTHSGHLGDAERVCRQLLRVEPRGAGAHLLLAIVRECQADDAGATAHCRTAAGLDASFAMPQVHLGRLAARARQRSAAISHFSTAIRLLPGETEDRMLLFSGGFEREALLSLCRTQLAQLETAR